MKWLQKLPAASKYIQQYKELKELAPFELMKHLHTNFGLDIGTQRHPIVLTQFNKMIINNSKQPRTYITLSVG